MTRPTMSLPEESAEQARAAGLRNDRGIPDLLRRALLARLDAHPEPLPSDAEIAEEIAAARHQYVALDAVKPRPLGFQGPC